MVCPQFNALFKTGTEEVVTELNYLQIIYKNTVLGLEKIERHKAIPALEI